MPLLAGCRQHGSASVASVLRARRNCKTGGGPCLRPRPRPRLLLVLPAVEQRTQRTACYYDEVSECAHISMTETACCRTDRTLVGSAGPRVGGSVHPFSVLESSKNEVAESSMPRTGTSPPARHRFPPRGSAELLQAVLPVQRSRA